MRDQWLRRLTTRASWMLLQGLDAWRRRTAHAPAPSEVLSLVLHCRQRRTPQSPHLFGRLTATRQLMPRLEGMPVLPPLATRGSKRRAGGVAALTSLSACVACVWCWPAWAPDLAPIHLFHTSITGAHPISCHQITANHRFCFMEA